MSENPLRVGMASTVPLIDIRKLSLWGDHEDPPLDEMSDRKFGAGFTSVVGVTELMSLLPLRTTKN
jgi:hypothetical protein